MRSRRSLLGWGALALAVLFGVGGAAQGAPATGLQSAQFEVLSLAQGQGGQVTVTSKIWVKGKKARVEVSNPLAGEMIVIADGKTLYQLHPAQKQAVRTDQAKATGGRDPWQIFVANVEQLRRGARKQGTERVEGYLCDIYTRSDSSQGRSASLRAWITRSLRPPLPLKVVREMKIRRPNANITESLTIRVRNLRLNVPVADRLFTLPQGYRVVEGPPSMPGGGGMAPGMGMPGGGAPRGPR
jgi:outer membrane lipoprotein-sorting protein